MTKRVHVLSIIAAVVLLLCPAIADAPPEHLPADTPEALRQRITALLDPARHGPEARLGLYVADTRTRRPLITHNADDAFTPASLLKILTAAAVLDTLGPERRFETTLEQEGVLGRDGVLRGDLRLRGGGDPSFGPRYQVDRTDITRVLRQWAADVRDAGIREVTGTIIADDTLFAEDRFGPGWPGDQRAEWYAAEVSALSFNDNTIDVVIKGSGRARDRSQIRSTPKTRYATIVNSVRTGSADVGESWVRFYRTPQGSEIVARGILRPNEVREAYAAVRDPAWYTATVFAEELAEAGVRLARENQVRPARLLLDDPGRDTTGTLVLSRQTSPPVGAMMPVVLGVSQNLYAEVLLRHLALARGEPPSFRGGAAALQQWMAEAGVPTAGAAIVDGSGLSRINRLTPRQVGRALEVAAAREWAPVFRAGLAEPGAPGSMRSRFRPDERVELRGRLRAKTGTLDGVHGLAGYLTTPWGGDYTFVVILNGSTASLQDQRRVLEDAVLLMARSPALP